MFPFTVQLQATLDRRDSYEVSQIGDNTYATILPRNSSQSMSNSEGHNTIRGIGAPGNGISTITSANSEVADYATLRNNSRPPSTVSHKSMKEFKKKIF